MNNRTSPSSEATPQSKAGTLLASQGELKIFSATIDWSTTERMELVNITERVQEVISKSSICNGLAHLQSLHTTTALIVNEWQSALLEDIKAHLTQMVPRERDWRHNNPQYSDCERRNADSHLTGMILGQSLSLQIQNSILVLGTWQQIILAEFDGPRRRSVSIQVFGI
jgi:secondary thiamine-phosphate synthase enzyme